MTALNAKIPEAITVHLGIPSCPVQNITVPFPDYVKNVASGASYPTWEESALRAIILAVTSFALNRVYTAFYRSRGYPFDITSSATFDQSFSKGRNYFDRISQLVDEIFDDYIRQQDRPEPLAATFCNGTTVTCDGLSQWGSQNLARQGYDFLEILKTYYGHDIALVLEAPPQMPAPPYPGTPLRVGDTGANVSFLQVALNRISQNYPAIPKINPVDGRFGPVMLSAIETLQEIFGLTADGIVGKAVWQLIVRLETAAKKLSEICSEGQAFVGVSWAYPAAMQEGDAGIKVTHLQYMLSVLSEFYNSVPAVSLSGIYNTATKESVLAFQQMAHLPQSGIADANTWEAVYNAYAGISNLVFSRCALFPYPNDSDPADTVQALQHQLQTMSDAQPGLLRPALTGRMDQQTQQALRQFQKSAGLPVTGQADDATKTILASCVGGLRFANSSRFAQFPGFDLRFGMEDNMREVICP